MPNDVSSNDYTPNNNLPAIWALNAKIPRTSQYALKPNNPCSCWKSGCGELDLFEVIKDAPQYCKTHYHSSQGGLGGGCPDYFDRPVGKFVKGMVIFDGVKQVTIKLNAGDSLDFGASYGESFINSMVEKSAKGLASVFEVPS